MDYMEQLEMAWEYFPYFFYAFILLTFLPKSLGKIKKFADADYEANRNRYHRCYGPELCCHRLIEHEDERDVPKAKPRKAVTRSYLRKQQQQQQEQPPPQQQRHNVDDMLMAPMPPIPIRRQVQASAIQTQTNVNQIAKMFESGSGSMAHKKINRVLPEIRTNGSMHQRKGSCDNSQQHQQHHENITTSASEALTVKKSHNSQLSQLLQENIENSMNLLHQQASSDDHSESTASATLPTVVLQRRRGRIAPTTLTYAGTSATPSTASPAASTPHSSSPASTNNNSPAQPSSPIMRHAPLNLKTSVEDIFAAIARSAEKSEEQFIYTGCNTLSPVTSIDDILSQRRLSRPLSAYSISDLLNEEINANAPQVVSKDGATYCTITGNGGGGINGVTTDSIFVESYC